MIESIQWIISFSRSSDKLRHAYWEHNPVSAVKTQDNQHTELHYGKYIHADVIPDDCRVYSKNQYSFAWDLLSVIQDTVDRGYNLFIEVDNNQQV